MKKFILYIITVFSLLQVQGQILPDSIIDKYHTTKNISDKGQVLYSYVKDAMLGSAAEKIQVLLNTKKYFQKENDHVGENYIGLLIGSISWKLGEYSTSLNYSIPTLKFFEEGKDTFGIVLALKEIGNSFVNSKNYNDGLNYWQKSLPIARMYSNSGFITAILNNTGDCFNRMNLPDSALKYVQEAVKIAEESKDYSGLSIYYSTLAEIYLLRGDHEIARPFLKKSIYYSRPNDRYGIAFTYNILSKSFFETAQYDSTLTYLRKALYLGEPDLKDILMTTYETFYKTYEKLNNKDSILKYLALTLQAKDSSFAIEKNRDIQVLSFKEQLRQQELLIENERLKENRKLNIEYALIALGLITFIIVFLLLSRSIITNSKWISFLGIVALLLIFEFLNLLLHPFLERITHHSPALMLLALVCIASLLIPLHHKIEKWSIAKLIEKNKKIRLATAKKTIEKLEEQNPENFPLP